MYRKVLIGMLRDHPVSVHQLALLLDSGERDVEADLQHLLRSLRNSDWRAVVTPARCRKCGFRFHADKLHKPGKCPACKGTWISDPLIGLEARR
jgi:predicted Zn-ribbon and HTH transcriptional regulator